MDDKVNKKKRGTKKSMSEQTKLTVGASGKPRVYDIIGTRLRGYFDEVVKQPVPDRFLELLKQLDATSKPKKEY